MAAITAPPCPRHTSPQSGCGGCRARAARALDIIDKLGALSGVTEAGLAAVAGGTQFLAGLTPCSAGSWRTTPATSPPSWLTPAGRCAMSGASSPPSPPAG